MDFSVLSIVYQTKQRLLDEARHTYIHSILNADDGGKKLRIELM